MSETLFDDAELFSGDPLRPDFEQVCPESVVASLTHAQRRERVNALVTQAHEIVDTGWEIFAQGRMRAAWCVLYSGGNDSTVLTHLFKDRVDYAVHANTTIGVEATRQFVRDTCKLWGLDLLERTAPTSYRELVLDQGFPGPGMHYKMYQRLKERVLEQVRNELVTDSRRQRVLFIAGRRRSESRRRKHIPLYEGDGSIVWASPLAMWTKTDLVVYRSMQKDVPFNPVTDHLGMSGECLCGAFAKPNEMELLRFWYPDIAQELDQLQDDVKAAGHKDPYCVWGHGKGKPPEQIGRLCSSCTLDQPGLWEAS